MAAVTARPAARAEGTGLDCGMLNRGTPRPATARKRLPNASAARRGSRPVGAETVPPGCSASRAGTGVLMVGTFACWGSGFGLFLWLRCCCGHPCRRGATRAVSQPRLCVCWTADVRVGVAPRGAQDHVARTVNLPHEL